MPDPQTAEIQNNYQYFQGVVGSMMRDHEGKFALLHARSIVDVYSRPIEAMQEGLRRFEDGVFSVQRVTDRPVDLGFLSNAADDGITI